MTLVVAVGLVVAAAAWAWLFARPRRPGTAFGPIRPGFWNRAPVAGLVIGSYAAVAQRQRLEALLSPTLLDVAIGVGAAAALYGAFWLGDRLITASFPALADQVVDLYALRSSAPPARMIGVLVLVGSCEEIFWRGFVQSRAGVAVALAGYAAVHLWERKAVLVLAAVAGGAAWAALYSWRTTLVAPLVCHVLWDLAVVVWFPFRPRGR